MGPCALRLRQSSSKSLTGIRPFDRDTYSHLWPDSDDRTRDAIDSHRAEPDTVGWVVDGHHRLC